MEPGDCGDNGCLSKSISTCQGLLVQPGVEIAGQCERSTWSIRLNRSALRVRVVVKVREVGAQIVIIEELENPEAMLVVLREHQLGGVSLSKALLH